MRDFVNLSRKDSFGNIDILDRRFILRHGYDVYDIIADHWKITFYYDGIQGDTANYLHLFEGDRERFLTDLVLLKMTTP